MKKLLCLQILIISVLIARTFLARPASAIVPTVQSVAPYSQDGSTFLNITINHTPEDPGIPHYVDIIRVTMGTNTTDKTISSQPLRPDNTFVITYDLGPIVGIPTITVDAHCIVNGWASALSQDWTGAVPELSIPMLLLSLTAASCSVVFILRRSKKHA